jgi:hypothetical protein
MRISLFMLHIAALLALGSPSGAASEIYYCEDGRILAVDASNRRQLAGDPCVKAWFEATRRNRPTWQRRAMLSAPTLPWCGCLYHRCYTGFVIYAWRRHRW